MPKNKRAQGLSALDAAVEVLRETKGPLHFRELTERMIKRGLWASEGKTPWASVQAQIAVEIQKLGSQSRFRRTGRGEFELSKAASAKR
jgi:restriction system protein